VKFQNKNQSSNNILKNFSKLSDNPNRGNYNSLNTSSYITTYPMRIHTKEAQKSLQFIRNKNGSLPFRKPNKTVFNSINSNQDGSMSIKIT
jgi:hypothetical protein